MHKRVIRILIIIYAIACLLFVVRGVYRSYISNLVNNSPFYCNNRDYVMGLFFKKRTQINEEYDLLQVKDTTPKWYDIVRERPAFLVLGEGLSKDIQIIQAKEYIRQHVKGSVGIDHKRVEEWLVNIVKMTNFEKPLFTYEEVFNTPVGKYDSWNSMYEHHLRQIVSFIPFNEMWREFVKDSGIFLSIFPVLFGIPLLLTQIGVFIIRLITKRKHSILGLSKRALKVIFWVSLAIGIFYGARSLINQWSIGKATKFVVSKWEHIKIGLFSLPFAFVISFLGFWSAKVFYTLVSAELRLLRKR